MTVLTMLTLQVPHDRRDDVVRYYESAEILERSGSTSAQLCLPVTDPGTVVVFATWADPAAYDAWQASPVRAELSAGIGNAAGGSVTAESQVMDIVLDV